jgi:hypothetical protein
MRFLIRLFYVKSQRLFRKFFTTKQTVGQKRGHGVRILFSPKMTDEKLYERYEEMMKENKSPEDIMKALFTVQVLQTTQ